MKRSIELLNQMIDAARTEDAHHIKKNINKKASSTVGKSWWVFHLESLKEILEAETVGNDKS